MNKIVITIVMLLLFLGTFLFIFMGGNDKKNNDITETTATENENINNPDGLYTESKKPYDYDLSGYIKLEDISTVKYDPADVEKLYNESVAELLNSLTEEVSVTDRAVKEGDTVLIDYVGKVNGVAFEGGTAEDQSLTIGSGQYIEGFESGLVGKNLGETVELNLKFPEKYHNADLAGKDVVFTVSIKRIIEYITPTELTDELAKKASNGIYQTAEELLADIRKESLNSVVYSKYVQQCEVIKYPEKEMNDYFEQEKAYFEYMLMYQYGITLNEEVVKQLGYESLEAFYNMIREKGKAPIKNEMVLYHTVRTLNITVSDEEYKAFATEMLEGYQVETIEELETKISKESIYRALYLEKITGIIVDANSGDNAESDAMPEESVTATPSESESEPIETQTN